MHYFVFSPTLLCLIVVGGVEKAGAEGVVTLVKILKMGGS